MLEMNEQLARQILGETIQPDGSLFNRSQVIDWQHNEDTVNLDARRFKAEQLLAIAWWMTNK